MIQVSADGFELTQSMKDACEVEVNERLQSLAVKSLHVKWVLFIERAEQAAHMTWQDGVFHGDVTVRSGDMYNSIHQCAKKASEQIKKSHEKKQNHHKSSRANFESE